MSSNASPAKMICLDPDGKLSLDYWSVGAVENYLKLIDSAELVKLAEDGFNHAVEQQKEFATTNEKLFRRYCAFLS